MSPTNRIRIVAIEEHVVLPGLQAAWKRQPNFQERPNGGFGDTPLARRLRDTGKERIADMDSQGVDMQILSAMSPGVTALPSEEAIRAAREFNDELAAVVAAEPTRFKAWALLPTQAPEVAAEELERTVTKLGFCGAMIYGRSGDKKLDDKFFDPIYAMAAKLKVPIHFHPQAIPAEVNQAYYTGINQVLDFEFGGPGIGWYYDLGVQVLRMVLSGTFDRHPDLQVILGHWGEVVLFYLDHVQYLENRVKLERPFMDYFKKNIWVAGSGTQSERYLRWAAEVVGTERMLYSTDYPITFEAGYNVIETSANAARSFLETAPFSQAEISAIGSGNLQRLLGSTASFE